MKTKTTKESKGRGAKVRLSDAFLSTCIQLNQDFTAQGNVSPYVMAHYVNTATGEQGLSDLICAILRDNGAEFSGRDIAKNRKTVLARSMTAGSIIAEVQARFSQGSKRYSAGSIHTFLCQIMSKARTVKGREVPPIVGKLRQSTLEDNKRHSPKPRLVWFVIKRQQAAH